MCVPLNDMICAIRLWLCKVTEQVAPWPFICVAIVLSVQTKTGQIFKSSRKKPPKKPKTSKPEKLQSAPGNLYLRTTDPKGPGASPMKTAPTPSTNHLLSEFCLVITVPKGTPIMNTVESLQWLRASKHSGKFSLYGSRLREDTQPWKSHILNSPWAPHYRKAWKESLRPRYSILWMGDVTGAET